MLFARTCVHSPGTWILRIALQAFIFPRQNAARGGAGITKKCSPDGGPGAIWSRNSSKARRIPRKSGFEENQWDSIWVYVFLCQMESEVGAEPNIFVFAINLGFVCPNTCRIVGGFWGDSFARVANSGDANPTSFVMNSMFF